MNDIERLTLLVALLAGISGTLLQIWQRFDESRQSKRQLLLDEKRNKQEESRTLSDIEQQQTDIQLRLIEGLRAELLVLQSRVQTTIEELDKFKDKRSIEVTATFEIFDCIEEVLEKNMREGTEEDVDTKQLRMKIRKFRRQYIL